MGGGGEYKGILLVSVKGVSIVRDILLLAHFRLRHIRIIGGEGYYVSSLNPKPSKTTPVKPPSKKPTLQTIALKTLIPQT